MTKPENSSFLLVTDVTELSVLEWDEAERAETMAELDAAFFHLYDIPADDVEYILSTFQGIHDQRSLLSDGFSIAQRIVEKYTEMAP